MWIRRNLGVLSQNRTLKDARRCHQQLVGWIAMERLRQLGRFHYDPWIEVQKRDTRLGESGLYPKTDCPIELQPSVLDELCDFPTRDDTDTEYAVGATFEKLAVPRLEAIRPRNPPNPDVGIQQNHCRASQSSLATGSDGSQYSTTELRRLGSPAVVGPAVFEMTNTSTGWPASNGRPSKRSSPCLPTVVSLQCACTPSVYKDPATRWYAAIRYPVCAAIRSCRYPVPGSPLRRPAAQQRCRRGRRGPCQTRPRRIFRHAVAFARRQE